MLTRDYFISYSLEQPLAMWFSRELHELCFEKKFKYLRRYSSEIFQKHRGYPLFCVARYVLLYINIDEMEASEGSNKFTLFPSNFF